MNTLRSLLKGMLAVSIVSFGLAVPIEWAMAGDHTLKAKQIRALFPGNYEARVRGYKIAVVAKRNGSLSGSAFNQADNGRWWIKGNNLCVSWANWTDGKATCGRITKSGNWYVSKNTSGNKMKFRRY